MIKNTEQIKREIMGEIEKSVDKYIGKMKEGSNEAKFPIDKIERIMGEIIEDSRRIVIDKTSELIKNIDEEEIIKKTNIEKTEQKCTNTQKES